MMELVDDDHVEVIRREIPKTGGAEALNRGEHVFERLRSLTADPELAECRIAERVPEREETLIEDFFPMRDEQEPMPRKRLAQSRIINRGHHGLPGARRRREEIPVIPALARHGDLFEEPLLERLQPHLDRTQRDHGTRYAIDASLRGKFNWVIAHEVDAVPVAVEDRCHLRDHIWIPRA